MRKIPVTYGLLYFLDEIEHSDAALSADPDAAALAAPFKDALQEWELLFKSERGARREVTRANAVVGVRNEQLDTLTMRFSKLVRAVAEPLLPRFFGGTPGVFVRRSLRLQCEKTQTVLLPELEKVEAQSPLKVLAAPLQLATSAALAALDARASTKGQRQLAANESDEWKEGINVLRVTTYAELLKIAAAKGQPKSWVESFFRQDSAESEAEPSDPGDAAPVASPIAPPVTP